MQVSFQLIVGMANRNAFFEPPFENPGYGPVTPIVMRLPVFIVVDVIGCFVSLFLCNFLLGG